MPTSAEFVCREVAAAVGSPARSTEPPDTDAPIARFDVSPGDPDDRSPPRYGYPIGVLAITEIRVL